MHIVIVGATGAIGQRLVEAFSSHQQVTGVVRSLRPAANGNTRYVRYGDKTALAASLAAADVVIHAAIDKKVRGKAFLDANLALTREILDLTLGGTCRQFVYLSSTAVYAAATAQGPDGYNEDSICVDSDRLDAYTRLKVQCEAMVVDACTRADVSYLVLRPSIVVGPDLSWMERSTRLARGLPFGIKGRLMNLVHVDDVAAAVERLVALQVRDTTLNLGGHDYESDYFFAQVGRRASRNVRLLPSPFAGLVSRALPDSMWFLKRRAGVDSTRVREVTRISPLYVGESLFEASPLADTHIESLDAMRTVQRSDVPFRAFGLGYSLTLSPTPYVVRNRRIVMSPYNGIVGLQGRQVTVKAGTLLSEVARFLDQHDLALATLPEFSGITAGACFFVDVHGSSTAYFSLFDLIAAVKYLDPGGVEVAMHKGDPTWLAFRKRRESFFLTEVTFDCVPSGYLRNDIELTDDSTLEVWLRETHLKNFSTTVQWYPHAGRCMIYNINPAPQPPQRFVSPRTLYRNSSYRLQRAILRARMRGSRTQYGRYADVLSPWKDLPFRKSRPRLPKRHPKNFMSSVELLLNLDDSVRLVQRLREVARDAASWLPRNASLGFRFAYRHSDGEAPQGFAWIELACNDVAVLDCYVGEARAVCQGEVRFHEGKHVPPDFVEVPAQQTAPALIEAGS